MELHTRCREPSVGHTDLEITAVDVGVYAGKYVNANQLSGINMGSLGRFGYLFVNNTENSGSHETLSRECH